MPTTVVTMTTECFRPWSGVTMTAASPPVRDIRVVHAATGELLRHLTLDPTRDCQPTGKPRSERDCCTIW